MDLIFERYGQKMYARTWGGELAFGENSGLHEWREGQRIDYTGGDRQHSGNGRMWMTGGRGEPARLGFAAAVSPLRMN